MLKHANRMIEKKVPPLRVTFIAGISCTDKSVEHDAEPRSLAFTRTNPCSALPPTISQCLRTVRGECREFSFSPLADRAG
jgi:hypothetical protein